MKTERLKILVQESWKVIEKCIEFQKSLFLEPPWTLQKMTKSNIETDFRIEISNFRVRGFEFACHEAFTQIGESPASSSLELDSSLGGHDVQR